MTGPSVPRAIVAFAASLGAGVFAASTQCSETEGMDGNEWTRGLLFLLGAVVLATVLAHRWWLLWIALAVTPPWISLVDCVVNDPMSDGIQFLFIPLEAVVTAVAAVVAFGLHRLMAMRSVGAYGAHLSANVSSADPKDGD